MGGPCVTDNTGACVAGPGIAPGSPAYEAGGLLLSYPAAGMTRIELASPDRQSGCFTRCIHPQMWSCAPKAVAEGIEPPDPKGRSLSKRVPGTSAGRHHHLAERKGVDSDVNFSTRLFGWKSSDGVTEAAKLPQSTLKGLRLHRVRASCRRLSACSSLLLWNRWDLNPLPPVCQTSALPVELRPHGGPAGTRTPISAVRGRHSSY